MTISLPHPVGPAPDRPGTARLVDTADGVAVAVRVVGDATADAAVVLAHGFTLHSADRRVAALAAALADAGSCVYCFDFRGHGESGGASTLGVDEIHDLDAVVRLAREAGHARVIVVGASMGGFVALRHAALIGGVDGIVSISAPATWGKAAKLRARVLALAATTSAGRWALGRRGTRVAHPAPAAPESPSDLAPGITVPVTVIHGDRDPYVPVGDAHAIHERLGGPARLAVMPGLGHAEVAYSPAFAASLAQMVGEMLAEAPPGA